MMRRIPALALLFLAAVIGVPLLGSQLLNKWLGVDVSGWVQAGIALISFPVILYELDQIREAVNRKPRLEIGLANIQDLPFSEVREQQELPSIVKVSSGYAHFYIVLRNRGKAPARYVKVYVEHINREQNVSPPPLVKVSEFAENKPSFVHEHNFDFVFRAGTDWIINPNDIEPFGFHITTSVIVEETNSAGVKMTHPQYPPPCEVILDCTVWAEGLNQPQKKRFFVNVVERLERNSNGKEQP
jgi:hypothetical protein